jgi:hypothetical protein
MTRGVLSVLAVMGILLAWRTAALGQESAEALPPAEERESDVAGLVQQLDADRFSDRQAASEKLAAAGASAIPALIEAAQTGAPETAARSVNILGDHLMKGDPSVKAAAKTALETIAQGENAVAARRAKAALEESERPQTPPLAANGRPLPIRIFGGGIQGGIQIGQIGGNGQIQIQVAQNNGVQVRRVAIANNNGVKQIEAEEGGRKVKIKDDPNNGIEMEVTETKDGKETTQRYQAKNADELKKNHPDAHKIYEQYNNQGQPAPGNAAFDGARRIAETRIDSLQRSLQSLERTLDQLQNNLGQEKTKEIKQHIENVNKELDEAKKKLRDEPPARPAEEKANNQAENAGQN